ncbi:hypothetical protein BKA70DRAFT_1238740 [Coprinopsis sp. MPI-PUGE-AT-0042]|nr:hypothetical protein BKA70DRAFT_1238740 [Coprinopsis sp. MPI-PUGE-AT-0042]
MANETYGGMPASQSLNPAHIIPPTASSEYSATSRSVTIINRRHKEMTKEEIIRAKDAVILAQRRMIELLRRRVRELKKELYIADRVQALTREILDLSVLDEYWYCPKICSNSLNQSSNPTFPSPMSASNGREPGIQSEARQETETRTVFMSVHNMRLTDRFPMLCSEASTKDTLISMLITQMLEAQDLRDRLAFVDRLWSQNRCKMEDILRGSSEE